MTIRASFTGALGCSLPILLLLTPLVLGSPAQAQRGRRPALGTAAPVPMQPSWQSPRELERASHDLAKAQRHLAEASFFAQRGSSPEAARLLELSRQSLAEAQNALQRGNVFAVREQAKAAENLAKAAKALYEAELALGAVLAVPSSRPPCAPKSPSAGCRRRWPSPTSPPALWPSCSSKPSSC
ncbi:hypothetical protein NW851_05835 [Synechococcus sp. H55.7]|uniref:hypothetical protein n=1 Tax=unclassified Synechococcus TaxID=2626047 RepID=UPI0039C155E9